MSKVDITSVSEIKASTGKLRQFCQDFADTAQQLQQATQQLTENAEGWQTEASQVFRENIDNAKKWLDEIAQVVIEFAAAVDQAMDNDQEADSQSSTFFK